ncbi:MAG: carbohydrate-binding domain-containing protein [Clostridia bacterium]|nr:carbohydrate-binding domain-containing protein [Clostridia bacterium]
MKKRKAAACALSVAVAAAICIVAAGCGGWTNPGDYLGGGGTATYFPEETETALQEAAEEAAGDIAEAAYTDADSVKANCSKLTKKTISSSGSYYLDDDSLAGKKISVEAEDVTLYLINAELSNDGKCIESEEYGLTLTLIGSSTITNSGDAKNAVDIEQELVINGPGSLSISSTKNGIKAGSIKIRDASVETEADQDGLHAEIAEYDDAGKAPAFSYDKGGFVYIQDAAVSVNAADDGIQADTFVYIAGNSDIDVKTNGGAPSSLSQITDSSSDKVSGKGIKAGLIDWGEADNDLTLSGDEEEDYLILITGGNISVDSNDDAVHSNGQIIMTAGTLDVTTGDDGMHADNLMKISGGDIDIERCYEGIESAKVEISGGDISVTSSDDGINGADGTASRMGSANNNCHIIISGGNVYVDAGGDGVDSNGSMTISGGSLYVSGSTSGNDAALDADGSIIVDGGYLFACGALGMVETPASNSGQNVVSYASSGTIEAGKTLYLTDSDKNTIMYFTVPKKCQSVIISAPELEDGNTYYIYGDGTSLCSFTVSGIITIVGSSRSISSGGGSGLGRGFGRK